MKRTVVSILILFSLFNHTKAQQGIDTVATDTLQYWKLGGSLAVNFSQVQLENWAGGGQSSISVNSIVKLQASFEKGKSVWQNRFNIAYGLIRQGEDVDFRKTDDVLNLISKYNFQVNDKFYISALADFRTQLDNGFKFTDNKDGTITKQRISDFMAPGFLIASIGATYLKKDVSYSITISPVTSKFTFVMDDSLSNAGAFGVSEGEKLRGEFGASLNGTFQRDILKNVTLTSNLSLFGNYDSFSKIDVLWEGALVMKVNKYINSSVTSQLVYDHDVIKKTQWKNVINVGFLLTF